MEQSQERCAFCRRFLLTERRALSLSGGVPISSKSRKNPQTIE